MSASLRLLISVILVTALGTVRADDASKPLEVLLVAGGCCHDYATQTKLLKAGIEERVRANVTVAYNPDTTTKARFVIYEKDDWAEPYDVVVHDECSADVTEGAYVKRILEAHRAGKPAVNIHCAMHCYRWGDFRNPVAAGADNAGWFEMIGLQSTGHGPQFPIAVAYESHPITKGLADWTTINEELYNNIQVMPTATPLAMGVQKVLPRGKQADPAAEPKEAKAVIAWTNAFGPQKTRIFSTSLGHNNDTVSDDRYLELIVRGILWSVGKLADDGTPTAGYARKAPSPGGAE
jgi:type 1 glutamine amidotransferase